MPLILFSLSNDDSCSGSNTICLRIDVGIAPNTFSFFLASDRDNGEPPFGVPSSLGILGSLVVLLSILPVLSLPNGSYWVPIMDVFSWGRPIGFFSSYPPGTSAFCPILPAPYNEARSCGVP